MKKIFYMCTRVRRRHHRMYLYLATNYKSGTHITTKIGCASDIAERLTLLNSLTNGPGTERRARHAPGYWRMLLVIYVPRELSARAIACQWAHDARKVHCRFRYGVESIAQHYRLPYLVNTAELRADTPLTRTIPAFVASVLAAVVPSTADGVRALTRVSAARTHYKTLSFARLDRPRARYRKRAASQRDAHERAHVATPAALDALLRDALVAK